MMKQLMMILLTLVLTAATTVAAVEVFKPGTFLKHPRHEVCQALSKQLAIETYSWRGPDRRRLSYAQCLAGFKPLVD
ncbi:MAG: hypothetical protein V3S25_05485 [Nitrospirales bacterium]